MGRDLVVAQAPAHGKSSRALNYVNVNTPTGPSDVSKLNIRKVLLYSAGRCCIAQLLSTLGGSRCVASHTPQLTENSDIMRTMLGSWKNYIKNEKHHINGLAERIYSE